MLPIRKSKMERSTKSSKRRPWWRRRSMTMKKENSFNQKLPKLLNLIIRVNIPNDITVVRVGFPLSFSTLVVASPPWVTPSFPEFIFLDPRMLVIRIGVLPWCKVFGWEKGSETSLEHIWASANCVRGVAVVGALAYDIMITIIYI